MAGIILRVLGTECSLATDELTIERLVAEAHAVGLGEFLVFRNGEEVSSPDQFVVEEGDLYVIADPKQQQEIENSETEAYDESE